MKKITFFSADQTKLRGIWHIPKIPTQNAVILAHGITVDKNEDNDVFVKLAHRLEGEGVAVFRFDFRGHGESSGESVDMTITGELQDLDAAVREVQSKGFSRIGLLGASFGGGIATVYIHSHPNMFVSLCLWNPCLNYDHCFLNPTLPWLLKRKGHMKKDLEEKGWTTIGSRNFIIGKGLFDEMAARFPYKDITSISIPLLIIHGDADTYVPYEDSQHAIVGMKHAHLHTILGGEHGFSDHENQMSEAIEVSVQFFQQYFRLIFST